MSEQGMNNVEQNAQENAKKNANKKSAGQKAKAAKQKIEKAKKLVDKAKKIKRLSSVVTFFGWFLLILVIIIILIGFIAFFLTMPGLIIDKFLKTCEEALKNFLGVEVIEVDDAQLVDLGNYIEELGYDLHAYGFANEAFIDRESNSATSGGTSGTKGKITNIQTGVKYVGSKKTALKVFTQMNSSNIELPMTAGEAILSKDILEDGAAIKGKNGKYYKAVDANGANIKFFNSNNKPIKYTIDYDTNEYPIFKKEGGKKTYKDLASDIYAVSYNEFKAVKDTLSDSDKVAMLTGQARLYSQLIYFLATVDYELDDNMKNYEIVKIANNVKNDGRKMYSSERTISLFGYDFTFDIDGDELCQSIMREIDLFVGDFITPNSNTPMALLKITSYIKSNDYQGLDNFIKEMKDIIESFNEEYDDLVTKNEAVERPKLFSYILANERTYTAKGLKQNKLEAASMYVPLVGDLLADSMENIRGFFEILYPQGFGMIVFPNSAFDEDPSAQKGSFQAEIDREENSLEIRVTRVKKYRNGNEEELEDTTKWSLAGWTARYGKPIELSLALHLSTMAPDFVYNFCSHRDLQTEVHMKMQKTAYKIKYYYVTKNERTVYRDNQYDKNGKITEEGVMSIYENYYGMKDIRNNAKKLLNTKVEVREDIQEDYDEEDLPFLNLTAWLNNNILGNYNGNVNLYPIDALGDTSLISMTKIDDNGNYIEGEGIFKAVDNDKRPIEFYKSYEIGGNIRNETYRYTIVLRNGIPFFNKVYGSNPYTFDTKDLIDGNEIIIDFGSAGKYKLKLKLLSLKQVAYLMEFKEYNQSVKQYEYIFEPCTTVFNKEYAKLALYEDTIVAYEQTIQGLKDTRFKDLCEKYSINVDLKLEEFTFSDNGDIVNNINYNYSVKDGKTEYEPGVLNSFKLIKNRMQSYEFDRQKTIEMFHNFTEFMKVNIDAFRDDNDLNAISTIDLFSYCIDKYLAKNEMIMLEFIQVYRIFDAANTEFETYQPYIEKVINHWYKDIYFEDDGSKTGQVHQSYNKKSKNEMEGDYRPDDDSVVNINLLPGTLKYKATPKAGSYSVEQIAQPIIYKKESWHYMVKNWLKYGYYFIYDGTTRTANEITKAKKELKDKNIYDTANPLLINNIDQESLSEDGGQNPIGSQSIAKQIDQRAKDINGYLERNGYNVKLKRINFEKKSSLTAFSMLEGMHTEDTEYIYRDLKEFLIELGYFTRADFESIETNVFKWLIKGYRVYKDEWPDPQYEINPTEFGTYVRSTASLMAQKRDEAEAKTKKTNNSTSSSISGTAVMGDGYSTFTTVNGIDYKDYKQGGGTYGNTAFGAGVMADSGCGPTSVAILMSGYGGNYSPRDIADMVQNIGETNSVVLATVMNQLEVSCYRGNITGQGDKDRIMNALEEGKPVLIGGRFTGEGHWICILGMENDTVIISDPGNVATVTPYLKCDRAKIMEMLSTYGDGYIIPDALPTGAGANNKKVLEGFKEGLDIIAPETGVIEEIGTIEEDTTDNAENGNENSANNENNSSNNNTNNNTQNSSEESEYDKKMEEIRQKHMTTTGKYIIIKFKTANGVDNWKMKIEGLTIDAEIEDKVKEQEAKANENGNVNENGNENANENANENTNENENGNRNVTIKDEDKVKVNKNDVIGKTNSGNIKIILYDDKDAIINDVADYFKLKKRDPSKLAQEYDFSDEDIELLARLIARENNPDYCSFLLGGDDEGGMNVAKATGYACINFALKNNITIEEELLNPEYNRRYGADKSDFDLTQPPNPDHPITQKVMEAVEWCVKYDSTSITNPDGVPMSRNVIGQSGWDNCPGHPVHGTTYNADDLNCWWVLDWVNRGTHGVIEDAGPDNSGLSESELPPYDEFFCYDILP